MQRIDHATRALNLFGTGKDGFTGGSPSTQVAPTTVTPGFLNNLQEELANAVEAANIPLDGADRSQLAASFDVRLRLMALANHIESSTAFSQVDQAAYGAGRTVMVANYGSITYSDDHDTWAAATPGSGYAGHFRGVHYANGLWVIVGDAAEIQTSPDGITWTHRAKAGAYGGDFQGVSYGAGLWVIVGTTAEIQTSPDGITWTHRAPGGGATNTITRIAFGSGFFVASTSDGTVQRSADAITWAKHTHSANMGDIAFGAGVFVTSGFNIYTSPDGVTWTLRVTSSDASHLTRGPRLFVAVGDSGKLMASANGITWRVFRNNDFASTNFYGPVESDGAITFSTDANAYRRSLFF